MGVVSKCTVSVHKLVDAFVNNNISGQLLESGWKCAVACLQAVIGPHALGGLKALAGILGAKRAGRVAGDDAFALVDMAGTVTWLLSESHLSHNQNLVQKW